MADLTITAADVAPGNATQLSPLPLGETVGNGKLVYKNESDSQWYLADADDASKYNATAYVINGAASGGIAFGVAIKGVNVTVGATLVAETVYILSDTAGGIKPLADLASGDRLVIFGVAISTTQLNTIFHDTGYTKA